jgi:F420-0:gamma-glutamyl ligase-like protein
MVIETGYWIPGDNYLRIIAEILKNKIDNGDIVAISEKALSTVKGQIIDESKVKPSLLSKLLVHIWMHFIWGYFIGHLCHLKQKNINRLRRYPIKEGSAHKQVVLFNATFLQALNWGSEGGIDASNLPFSYVSLPLSDPLETAEEIKSYLWTNLGKKVTVMIVDTDKTYTFRNFHFTHRPSSLKGIHSFLGIISYIIGRSLRLKRRSTPLAIAGSRIEVNLALNIAETVNKFRGSGAGSTVWDMSETFGVDMMCVTWDMLKNIKHKPIVTLKRDKVSARYFYT